MDDVYLNKVLKGETQEYRYFIKTYKNLAYNIALSIVKNESEAEEVVQEAFIQAYTSLKSFDKRSKFSTWLCRIVINGSFKHLGRLISHESIDIIKHEASNDFKVSGNDQDYYSHEEQVYFIQKAFSQIGADEALALNLFYLQELSLQEITTITGWSVSKAKVTLHRARIHMKEKLFALGKQNLLTQ